MVKAGEEVFSCAYPCCENESRPEAAKQGYCGPPDPAAGEPHMALTGFRWR